MTTGGTVVCGVDGSRSARDALQLARALSKRLGLRLVVAHVARDDDRLRAGARLLDEISGGAKGAGRPEVRLGAGDRAARLAEIAAEEGADLIIIGSASSRRRRLGTRGVLAHELESATSCPVLIAPRLTRPRSQMRLARAHVTGAS